MRIAVVAAFALVSGRAFAFHAGGVAKCEGCHTMHNSTTAAAGTASTAMGTGSAIIGQASPYLLQGKDPSSTCLICHGKTGVSSYHVYEPALAATSTVAFSATMVNFTPGGDFAWANNQNFKKGTTVYTQRLGHSIIAADVGMSADSRKAAPAGDQAQAYDGEGFSCIACHDPHGKTRVDATGAIVTGVPIESSGSYGASPADATVAVGAYRLLAGPGYTAKSIPSLPAFTQAPPLAVAPSSYNAPETTYAGAGGPGQTVVAYGKGMSEWCATCHPGMHNDTQLTSGSIFKHPAGAAAKLTNVAATYNKYVKTGDLTGTNAYDALVPFEQNVARDVLATKAVGVTGTASITADGTASVMCLSCHRAHATPFEFALRWADSEFIVENGVYFGVEDGNRDSNGWRSAAMVQAGHQNRPAAAFSTFQKSLCNKCHAKD